MLIQKKLRQILNGEITMKAIDWVVLEWYETNKRILHKKTLMGRELSMKFMNENPDLSPGDVLFEDELTIIAVDVLPCECIVIRPIGMEEVATICYEIGNKHLPLFIENDELLIPFEEPIFNLLQAQGYDVCKDKKKLTTRLKTTVSPHSQAGETLFSKILRLTVADE